MDKHERKLFCKRILLIVGMVLLVICIALVTYTSIESRQKTIEKIDASLQTRADKIRTLNSAQLGTSIFELGEDALIIEGDGVFADLVLDVKTNDAVPDYRMPYSYLPTDPLVRMNRYRAEMELIFIGNVSGDTDASSLDAELPAFTAIPMPLLRDTDDDWIGMSGIKYTFTPSGLIYGEQLQAEYRSMIGIYTKGFSDLSQMNDELLEKSRDIIDQGTGFGWEGEYRYCCFAEDVLARQNDRDVSVIEYAYVDPDRFTEAAIGSFISSGEEKGYKKYTLHTVMFYDATEDLQTWNEHVIWNSGVVAGGYVVIMLVLGLLLFFMIPVREKIEPKPADEKIPDSLVQEMLRKIDAAEQSTGPNGYLDELRDTLRSVGQEQSQSDKDEKIAMPPAKEFGEEFQMPPNEEDEEDR
ncbi:MAG: hypothetical protein J5379_08560 [Clostridiales bacterium]|nr:hypothetical protein [Clostridiales bacterium]